MVEVKDMNDKRPHFMVLLSTYNGEKYIEQQLDSILKQKDVKLTLVIRDDGSTDKTWEIICRYKEKYDNIHIYGGENIGPCQSFFDLFYSYALNIDSDYIAFSDQDDIWKEGKLIRTVQYLDNKVPSLYYSALNMFDERDGSCILKRNSFTASFSEALIRSQFPGCTMVINKCAIEILHKVPCPKEAIMHDWFLYQFFVGMDCSVIYDRESYIDYRIHGDNYSITDKKIKKRVLKILKILKDAGKRLKAVEELRENYSMYFTQEAQEDLYLFYNYKRGNMNKYQCIRKLWNMHYSLNYKLLFSIAFLLEIY